MHFKLLRDVVETNGETSAGGCAKSIVGIQLCIPGPGLP